MVKTQSFKFKKQKRRKVQQNKDEEEGRQVHLDKERRRKRKKGMQKCTAGEGIIAPTKTNSSKRKSSGLGKAMKTLNRIKLKVAEKRGETRLIKELLKEEKTRLGNAVKKIKADIDIMRRENELKLQIDGCIRQFVDDMLLIFEREDSL